MKACLATLIAVLLIPSSVFAAISFDNVATNSTNNSTSPSTVSLTISASADEVVVCTNNSTASITDAKVGSTPMTLRSTVAGSVGHFNPTSEYELANPPTGAQTITVDFTGTLRGFVAASYIGAIGSFGVANQSIFTNSSTVTATSSAIAANSWTVGCMQSDGANPTAGAGNTLRGTQFGGFGMGDSNAAVSSTSMVWNWTGGVSGGNYTVISLSPTSGSGAAPFQLWPFSLF
jgi:hypothetical protein